MTPSDKSIPPTTARNTDGIDPGEGYLATSGAVVCNMISTGDDDIVLKGHYGVGNVVVAHNHFGTGHGMSIGSETQGIPGLTATDTASGSTTKWARVPARAPAPIARSVNSAALPSLSALNDLHARAFATIGCPSSPDLIQSAGC